LLNLKIHPHQETTVLSASFPPSHRFQSSFRSAYSTTTALLNVTDDFHKGCESRMITVLLLLDFSKVFDSVIHVFLCEKLSTIFKLDSTASSLIKSYFSSRSLSGMSSRAWFRFSKESPHTFLTLHLHLIDTIMFSQCHMYILAVKDLTFLAQSKNYLI
jgi:Reverse transcriptase (RNA-dependent DNA polymerase)